MRFAFEERILLLKERRRGEGGGGRKRESQTDSTLSTEPNAGLIPDPEIMT